MDSSKFPDTFFALSLNESGRLCHRQRVPNRPLAHHPEKPDRRVSAVKINQPPSIYPLTHRLAAICRSRLGFITAQWVDGF